jgi:hypothetical protein
MSCYHEWIEDEEGTECSQCGASKSIEIDESYDTIAEWRGIA